MRVCPKSPDLAPAAARLGITVAEYRQLSNPANDTPDEQLAKAKAGAEKLGVPYTPGLLPMLLRYAAGQPLGPGDYLHIAILKWVKESPKQGCGCENRIAQMNQWGIEGCREHLEEIVDWLVVEAGKREWWKYVVAVPFIPRMFIRKMIEGAIEKAEKWPGDKPAVKATEVTTG